MDYKGFNIRPLSDLRNNFADITRTAEESGQPVILTKHGRGRLVCMNYEDYEKRAFQYEIFDKLREAECEVASGVNRLTDAEVFNGLIQELEAIAGVGYDEV